ncbi:antibiotic ABC transporter ATP-binding protein [Terrimonas sp.]|uniref:ABC transporter ATP-binding protein n=1 Tax=Terrimonas sp. TaxID=1914338 RepID=UPI000D51E054|nr:ABC transporter ATP-binding protein [Terrimonas sp.]PVD53187.1 antibiotic ABC transporter ATP-binding protein [Terrimonas sp.]
MSETKPVKKLFDFSLLRRVFSYASPYKKQLYFSIFLAIALAVISPVRPWLIQLTVDKYIRGGLINWVIIITIIQIALLLLETAMRFSFSFITAWLGQTVVKDMRTAVYKKIVHLNLGQFDKTPIGTLTTRTINDIESINDIFSEGLIPIIADLLSIFAILGVMFYTDWELTLVCMAVLPVLLIVTWWFKESVNVSFQRVRNAVAQLNAFVQEHITGMSIVQAFAAEDREFAKFKKINREHRNANIKAIFAYSVFFPFVEIILAIAMGLMIWWSAKGAIEGEATLGVMIAFILYLNLLFRPLRVIADKFNVLQMGMVASERIFKVLDNPDFIEKEGDYAPSDMQGKVAFKHVWFAYKDDNYVLKNISFTIMPGETTALVGHTGSGKTSVISLINRLYHIQKGAIEIDDVNIEEYKLNILRSKIGIVLQDVFLFSGSIYENVTLRNESITRDQVIRAAKLIGMHDFIMQLPGNYDYNVMERGSTLSLGQRQLLSFIRALLYNPSILILDEATSSVDTESEQLIQHAIDTLIEGRTAIIIAHRLSTIRKADKILVLDKGEIKEMGTHSELLDKAGFYAKLYEMQFAKV